MPSEYIYTAIDFETTGTVPGWPVEPWQIGMVEVSLAGGVGRGFSALLGVPAERPFNRFAPGRHSLIRDELAIAPTLPQMWDEVSPWLIGRTLVAHNIGTERTILKKAAPLHSLGPWIDTLKLTRRIYPGLSSYALDDIISVLGLTAEVQKSCPGLTAHDAYYDAVACGVLLLHLLSVSNVAD